MTELNHEQLKLLRIPPEFEGFQINSCRNHLCENFGKPPLQKVSRGRSGVSDGYRVIGGWGKKMIYCTLCKQSFSLKSNIAIAEEFKRLISPYQAKVQGYCKNELCKNNLKPVSEYPNDYQNFGVTQVGSIRYRCKNCNKTFSIKTKPTHRQRKPENNGFILKALINKVPMRRICELIDINPPTLYQRIGFFKERCELFAQRYEQKLFEGFQIPHLRVAVDRQEYMFNWGSQFNRKNTKISAIGSADNSSGYVFGMHLDFDPKVNVFEAELHAREIKDDELDQPFRKYARIWLPNSKQIDASVAMPSTGAKVYSEYTMHAHFHLLNKLFNGVDKLSFYLDQENNINAACINAFADKIETNNTEAFYVQTNKSLSVNEKKLHLSARAKRFKGVENEWKEARKIVMKEYNHMIETKGRGKLWVKHPLPNMGEAEKKVCHITTRNTECSKETSDQILYASLHAIDRFFMVIRRRISLLERPISSASAVGRTWYGLSPYSPENIEKILNTFRIIYNFTLVGKDGLTPAIRLGLTDAVFSIDEILG